MTTSIILADDHAIFRQGLTQLLEPEHGFKLMAHVSNGREAWELIEALQPDVAILDITMDELTGIEVARKATNAGCRTRVLLLTMHSDPSLALEAQEAGAAGYVLKDNTFEELVAAVRTVVAGGTFMTASIQDRLRDIQSQGYTTIHLSNREREVVKLIALGHSSKEIGRLLGISHRTVDTHRNRLMGKLDLKTLADVVRYAVRTGIVS
jgi:DNA-binding NarL/FixJ family response regulator